MASDLSRPRELLETIWQQCASILPDHPPPDRAAVTSSQLKSRLTEWSDSCDVVTNALESAAAWFDRLGRPDDAMRLREDRERLTRLWHETYATYSTETKAFLAKQLPGETLDTWLKRLGSYNGSNLAIHIRRISQNARSLLNSLEATELTANDESAVAKLQAFAIALRLVGQKTAIIDAALQPIIAEQQAEIDRLQSEYGDVAQRIESDWEAEFGAPYPKEIKDWQRWAVRFGWSGERIAGGNWQLRDLFPIIEGYLQRLRDQSESAETATKGQGGAGDDPGRPKQYLSSWREILDALELPNNDESKNRVRGLVESYNGPIVLPSRGGQPKVEKTKLIEWWNDLENRFAESDQRIRDRDATVAATHNYGHDGTVAPNIRGSIKQHRTSSKVRKGPETS